MAQTKPKYLQNTCNRGQQRASILNKEFLTTRKYEIIQILKWAGVLNKYLTKEDLQKVVTCEKGSTLLVIETQTKTQWGRMGGSVG